MAGERAVNLAVVTTQLKGRVAVLQGGCSAERDISLQSGAAVVDAFQGMGLDVISIDPKDADWMKQLETEQIKHVFIALHGGRGEDGTIQAALELLDISYTGSGVLGSALAMDKLRSKQLWKGIGIATADYVELQPTSNWAEVMQLLGGKCIVKPALEGSSIGMAVAHTAEELKQAFDAAQNYCSSVIAEYWIEGFEYTVAILGNETLPVVQLQTDNTFYDFDAKYIQNDTRYICPSDLATEQETMMQTLALDAFSSLGCRGWGRVDIMVDARSNQAYVLEVNTVPGMTSHSLVPKAAQANEMSFADLVLTILALSVEVL